jgi:hypothetical protein
MKPFPWCYVCVSLVGWALFVCSLCGVHLHIQHFELAWWGWVLVFMATALLSPVVWMGSFFVVVWCGDDMKEISKAIGNRWDGKMKIWIHSIALLPWILWLIEGFFKYDG